MESSPLRRRHDASKDSDPRYAGDGLSAGVGNRRAGRCHCARLCRLTAAHEVIRVDPGARTGYTAVTFDFPGHGRNPRPLTGNITDANGATRVLVAETSRVALFARGLGDGRLAALGHSMASDIVVRFAQTTPDVAATVAVSMFSPVVNADSPPNLLIVVGAWESRLKKEALRAVGLAIAPAEPQPGVTYGGLRAWDSPTRRVQRPRRACRCAV